MTNFHIGNSDYLWFEFFSEAEYALDVSIRDDVKLYLISLISYHTDMIFFDGMPLGIEYLESQSIYRSDSRRLRKVADQCLLLAGMFPENAFKRNVTPDYFAKIAISSYFQLSGLGSPNKGKPSELYSSLSCDFYDVVRVLFYMRCCANRLEVNDSRIDLHKYCNGSYDEVIGLFRGPQW